MTIEPRLFGAVAALVATGTAVMPMLAPASLSAVPRTVTTTAQGAPTVLATVVVTATPL